MIGDGITPICATAAEIRDGEVFEPLGDGYGILQRKDCYRFGGDAVMLAKFAAQYLRKDKAVFDLCSGCGIIGMLLAIETGARVFGAELDKTLFDMSNRSAALNGLGGVRFYNADVRELENEAFTHRAFDAVVCNPPFFKAQSKSRAVAPTANSELSVTFCDIVKAAEYLLKPNGEFFAVHTASRLDEIVCAVTDAGLTPKVLAVNSNGKTFMLRCVLGGKRGLTVKVVGN